MAKEPTPKEVQAIKRKLSNARREIIKAVERMAEIDPLPGHIAEAKRRAQAVRDAAQDAVDAFQPKGR